MSAYVAVACCMLAPVLLLAQSSSSAVPLTSEPHHHLALQNAFTRVFKVEVAPHSATLLHRHDHDYMFVAIGPAEIENDVQGKGPVQVKLPNGATSFANGGFAHVAKNLSVQPFRNVTVEILKPAAPASPARPERGVTVGNGFTSDIVLDNPSVRATEITLEPGATLPARELRPHLVVAVSELAVRSQRQQQEKQLRLRPGDFVFADAGMTGTAANIGSQPAKFIEIEFK